MLFPLFFVPLQNIVYNTSLITKTHNSRMVVKKSEQIITKKGRICLLFNRRTSLHAQV